jgi:molecular chaperone HtpG
MVEGQTKIYYVTGEGKAAAAMSPALEKLKSQGYEVLFMTEPLDELAIQNIENYKDFPVVDATKLVAEDETTDEGKRKKSELESQVKPTIDYLEKILKGKIEKVEVSSRLTTSPATLVQGNFGMSPSMQRYMKAQAVQMGDEKKISGLGMINQAVLEINAEHDIVKKLTAMVSDSDKKDSIETKGYALLMYDVAMLTSGYTLDNPATFAKRVMAMMNGGNGFEDFDNDAEGSNTDHANPSTSDEDAAQRVREMMAGMNDVKEGDDSGEGVKDAEVVA